MLQRTAVACVVIAAMFTVPAHAAVLDQSYVPESPPMLWSDIGNNGQVDKVEQSQTIRVGVDGRLTGVDVGLMGYGESLLLEIRRTTSDGLPSDPPNGLLSAATASPGTLSNFEFVSFNLGENGPLVTAGEMLALVLKVPGAGLYDWGGSSSNPYDNGFATFRMNTNGAPWASAGSMNGQVDLAIRTYVEPVPEPSTVLIFAASGLGAWVMVRRTSR